MSTYDRMEAAEVRALDAFRSVGRKADELSEELDHITDHGSFPAVEMHEEDSAVTAIEDAVAQHLAVVAGGMRR